MAPLAICYDTGRLDACSSVCRSKYFQRTHSRSKIRPSTPIPCTGSYPPSQPFTCIILSTMAFSRCCNSSGSSSSPSAPPPSPAPLLPPLLPPPRPPRAADPGNLPPLLLLLLLSSRPGGTNFRFRTRPGPLGSRGGMGGPCPPLVFASSSKLLLPPYLHRQTQTAPKKHHCKGRYRVPLPTPRGQGTVVAYNKPFRPFFAHDRSPLGLLVQQQRDTYGLESEGTRGVVQLAPSSYTFRSHSRSPCISIGGPRGGDIHRWG